MTITRAEARRIKAAIDGVSSGSGVTEGDAGLGETNISLTTTVIEDNNDTTALVGTVRIYCIQCTKKSSGGSGILLNDGAANFLHLGAISVNETEVAYFPYGVLLATNLVRSSANGNLDITIYHTP